MKTRITLYADEGMMLTDGENYGTIVHLEAGLDGADYYEITKAEYDKIMEEQEKLLEEQMFNNIGASEGEAL